MFDVDRNQSDVGLSKSLVQPDSTDFKRKERSIMSMGDILPPRRQAVMDRLRRRVERYRLHQLSVLPRYNLNLNGLLTQQQQDTLILRQRFLETKAKKANKKSEPKSKAGLGGDSSGAGGGVGAGGSGPSSGTSATNTGGGGAGTAASNSNANLNGPQPKYKRTVEDTSSSPLSGCSRSASGQKKTGECSINTGISGGGGKTNNNSKLTQFSVEIEFSSPCQQIQTNVKVTTVASNTIKTSGSPAPSTGSSVVSSSNVSANSSTTTTATVIDPSEHGGGGATVRTVSKTSGVGAGGGSEKPVEESRDDKNGYQIECKQEPELNLDSCEVSSNGVSQNFTETLTNFDLNDEALKAFMEDWTTEDMNSMDLMNLEKFEDSVDPFRSDQNHLHGLAEPHHHQSDKMALDTERSLGQLPPYPVNNQSGLPMFPVSSSSPTDSMTLNLLTNMTNSTVRPPSYSTQATLGLDFLGKESSPAAQTLKQMAEQHQQQRQQQHLSNIGLNTSSPFTSDFNQFGTTGSGNGSGVSMDFLSQTAGNTGCFLPKSGNGPLFPFESNAMAPTSGNKASDGLFRSTQRFHLTSHLQEAPKNQLSQQRTNDPKSMCGGANGAGAGGPTQNILTGHCSPDINNGSGSTGSPLTFVGTKPLSHFGDSGQSNNSSPNNATRQYMRNPGGPAQQQRSQPSNGGAQSPSTNPVPGTLRQQRHHYIAMPAAQNGHLLQVSQGQHSNVNPDQQPTTMFSYGQPSPQVTPSATGDHFQLSLSQSQAVTFTGAGGNAIPNANSDRMVSVNQTTVVQMTAGGHMMSHHPQMLRPTSMQNQPEQPQQQQMMQMQMEKRKLNQQQVRNSHSVLTQFGVRPPPPDYGAQMNLMGGGQQQQPSAVMMPSVMTNQSGQLLMNSSNNSISRGANGPQPRLTSINVGGGGRLPMMNGRGGQQMNLGSSIGLSGAGVPVNGSRTTLAMGGRMAPFMGDDPRPPNVDIGPDGLNIGMRGTSGGGGVGQEWRQRITHNQLPGAKFQGTNVNQMSSVNPRFGGQVLTEQRGIQSNSVDNMQMMSIQQQQQMSMINRLGPGGVNSCPTQASHHHQLQHHQQMSMMQQQQGNSNSQQSVNAHLMTHISSSVVASTGAANFLSTDTSSGDFSEFFESGGFGANDLLNSLDLDIQNGNSGVNLL